MSNKYFIPLICIITILGSCKKESDPVVEPKPAPAEMIYTDLNNQEVKFQQNGVLVDVDRNGKADLLFDSYLIGDNINKVDKRQYYVLSSIRTFMPVNSNEQVPALQMKDLIPLKSFNGYEWNNASEIVLIERAEFENGAVIWRGNWLDKDRSYLPFQYVSNNQRYNGWVELTADKVGERLILHRMAISKHPEKDVKAGE